MDRYSITLGKPAPPAPPPKPSKPKSLKEQAKEFLGMPDADQVRGLQSFFGFNEEERQIADEQIHGIDRSENMPQSMTDSYEPTEADLESLREEATSVAEAANDIQIMHGITTTHAMEITVNGKTLTIDRRLFGVLSYRDIISMADLPYSDYYTVTYRAIGIFSSRRSMAFRDSVIANPGMIFDVAMTNSA